MPLSISEIRHPLYVANLFLWQLCRSAYSGGEGFISENLEKFSRRESDPDFQSRLRLTPNPVFAKSAIKEIENAVCTKLNRVLRLEGSDSYRQSCRGERGGVDRANNSMASFLAKKILPDLLTVSKIAVFVDNEVFGNTLIDANKSHPYLYTFRAEDLPAWSPDTGPLEKLTLCRCEYKFDEVYNLPIETQTTTLFLSQTLLSKMLSDIKLHS